MRRLAATRALFGAGFLVLSTFAAAAPPVKLQGLPFADFEKLPPGAEVDVGGRVLTKAQFLQELESKKQLAARTVPKADFESARAKQIADEKARIDAANAALRSGWKSEVADPKGAAAADPGGPRIDRIAGQPITHYGAVGIHGSGFGKEPGEIHLIGPFPGGHVDLSTCWGGSLGSWSGGGCEWGPHALYTGFTFGSVTPDHFVTGIPDQQLHVVVVTKKGERSAPFPVAFRARRVLERLKATDVAVWRSNPAEGPCGANDIAPFTGVTTTCPEGYDYSSTWHVGVDRVSATLRHGWTFDSHSYAFVHDGTAMNKNPLGFEYVQLNFEADRTVANATCTYFTVGLPHVCAIDLWAVGPEGVPFH